jgi:phosphatidylglycerol:prolipoprotein diacylglycerol transferase
MTMQTLAALPFFKLGPWNPIPGVDWLQIHAFGMFVALGLILCLAMATWRGERKMGFNGEKVQNFGLFLIVVGWIFAHVFNVLFYSPGEVLENPLILFKVWGSISSYGGLLGGILGVFIWHKMHPEDDMLLWVDHAAWTLTFAWMFGRLGCSSVHDHLGVYAPQWWPLAFEMPANYGGGFRHDLGFYEFLWWIVIVAVVMLVDRKPRKKGIYTAIIPLMYAPVRFTLDFLRFWPLPEDGDYDVPAHTQWVLDLFGIQPESMVYYENKLYTLKAPLDQQVQQLPPEFFQEAFSYGDTRYMGLTPAQYMSIGLFLLGLFMLWRIKDNEVVEWKTYDPKTGRTTPFEEDDSPEPATTDEE